MVRDVERSDHSFLFISGCPDNDDVAVFFVSSLENSDTFALRFDGYYSGSESEEGIGNVTNICSDVEA